jgi:hypothetical protein
MKTTKPPQWLIDAQNDAAEFAAYTNQFEAESQERLERVETTLRNVRKGLMKL